ncbi:MAG TPA: hypothetical protein VK518_06890 [Puia sp.]|nr:hypothetical protein [Puia sp.]
MFTLTTKPACEVFAVRPVNKTSDRSIIRNIFRQEFYGDSPKLYPDEGLWEIYERIDTRDVFGAYLVCEGDTVLFLLEIHPPVQMDLAGEYLLQKEEIGIYCFFQSPGAAANLPALSACIDSLLNYPSIRRIITSLGYVTPNEPKAILLKKTGFERHPGSTDKLSIYQCNRESFLRATRAVESSLVTH